MIRKADKAFLPFQEKIFLRDNHTCQFCGFQAKKHQDVVNLDGDYSNNSAANLVTACCFCSQGFFLEAIGKHEFGGGLLIYLPELTQGELNALCHVLFAMMVSGDEAKDKAREIYRSLKLRAQIVEKELGEGLTNPALYGHLLLDANVSGTEALHSKIGAKVRVLPNLNKYAEPLEGWMMDNLNALIG
jgi:intracellular multiplication protein IcmJ